MAEDQRPDGLDWEALRRFLLPPAVRHALGDVLGDEALAEVVRQVDRLREAGTPLLEGVQRAMAALGVSGPPRDVTVFAPTATAHAVAFAPAVTTRTLADAGAATDSIDVRRESGEFAALEAYFLVALVFGWTFIHAWFEVWRLRGQTPTGELAAAKDIVDWCATLYGLLVIARDMDRS